MHPASAFVLILSKRFILTTKNPVYEEDSRLGGGSRGEIPTDGSEKKTSQSRAKDEIRWIGCHVRSSLEGFVEQADSVRVLRSIK